MSFGTNVSYYRRKAKITQEELAERLDVTRQTVSRWETDSALPDVEMLIKLCEVFGCDMETLVRGNAEESEKRKSQSTNGIIPDLNIEKIQKNALLKTKIDTICDSVISSLAIIIFLVLGLGFGLWHPGWVVFPITAVICFIIQTITACVLTSPPFKIKKK